ncbi:hypothetical protein [Lysobacter antibioticus]|uniref:hypothetical protein n=1 Tax=Lysobacter antibioticus TaxID=84531 RepID=UPI000AE560CB|nr:hypothetical protein [Lysobacter antibioticus]
MPIPSIETCVWKLCFVPLASTSPKLFGFPELLAGLALLVLAWTIADSRYRFRVQIAPLPLQRVTYWTVALVGAFTLLTDLWRAEEWLVPTGDLLTPAMWQCLLAGIFLLTFLGWVWFAFVGRPKFGKHNAERFGRALYRYVLQGSPTELAVVADELVSSAHPLVKFSPEYARRRDLMESDEPIQLTKTAQLANDIFQLIADRRFCQVVVESSPVTALAIFQAINDLRKYHIGASTFARNIVTYALRNKNSFLYHETEGFQTGLLGHHKPLSQAMFGNFRLVEGLGTLLSPDYEDRWKWDAAQWEAYCRIVLITFRDYVNNHFHELSSTLTGAIESIEHAAFDLYRLEGQGDTWDSDAVRRLEVMLRFIERSVDILNGRGIPDGIRYRTKEGFWPENNYYDRIAELAFETIYLAGSIRSPWWECWTIQHNTVWRAIRDLDGPAGRVVKRKLRRLLYDEIEGMTIFQISRVQKS